MDATRTLDAPREREAVTKGMTKTMTKAVTMAVTMAADELDGRCPVHRHAPRRALRNAARLQCRSVVL
jgi:hypothetical protein